MEARRAASYGEENFNRMQESANEDLQSSKVSLFKIIASQFVAVFPIAFIKLRLGMGLGYTILLISELSKKDAEIDVTLDELTWFSSYCFIIPVASLSGGFVAQYTGVRPLLIFSFLLYISADLLFYWANSAAIILVAQVGVGFALGIAMGPSYTYIAEILQPKFRSVTLAAINLSSFFGRFLGLLLGNFMYWRTQAFVSLAISVIGFILIQFIPDSPQWLASKNRFEDAEKSLARVRGWTTPGAVKAELYSSLINTTSATSLTETSPETGLHSRKGTKLKKALSLYFDRSFYIPLLIMTTMSFFTQFNGTHGLVVFSVMIFEEIKSPIGSRVGSTIIPALSTVSSFVYIFSVRFIGKRIITLASTFIIAVCFTVAVTLLYLTNSEICSWIISISLILSSFAQSFGLGKVIFLLNSELFPQKLRYVDGGVGYFIDQIMAAIFDKSFLYIVKAITFPGTLIIFTVINIVAFIVIYFILPETEGITLLQIEENYVDKQNLKK